jgi:AbrB family looped-hinge helix DNA binding protein
MRFETKVSSKGQVTVPIEIRRRLGVKSGDRVQFVVKQGEVVLLPARGAENPFEKWIGALAKGTPEGTAVAWVREMRNDEFGGPGDERDK